MAAPSIGPRQVSPLNLQVKLPATADAAQAEPTSPCTASLLSCLGKLSWGWEVPHKKTGLSAVYLMVWGPSTHIPMSDCPPVHITQHKRRKVQCDVGNTGWMRSPAGQQAHSIFTQELSQKKVLWINLSNQTNSLKVSSRRK